MKGTTLLIAPSTLRLMMPARLPRTGAKNEPSVVVRSLSLIPTLQHIENSYHKLQ